MKVYSCTFNETVLHQSVQRQFVEDFYCGAKTMCKFLHERSRESLFPEAKGTLRFEVREGLNEPSSVISEYY